MATPPLIEFVRQAKLSRVVDGDTLLLEIDLGWGAYLSHAIRLLGVNTPESRGVEAPAGKWVTKQVAAFFGDCRAVVIRSDQFSLGKFGRCLCTVWVEERCLNHWLLDSQFGWPTDDDGTIIGSRSLDRLVLPDGIRRQCLERMSS